MVFFRSKPNVNTGEKARLEYWTSEIVQVLGKRRLNLGVLQVSDFMEPINGAVGDSIKISSDHLQLIGKHLEFDTSPINVRFDSKTLSKCGGGG